MPDPNKVFLLATTAFLAGAWLAQPGYAHADPAKDYPNKPVRFIVHSAAGGGPDIPARAIAASAC